MVEMTVHDEQSGYTALATGWFLKKVTVTTVPFTMFLSIFSRFVAAI